MSKNNLLRFILTGVFLTTLTGAGQAACPMVARPACKFIHYFEAAGESRQLSMVERAWLALLMTGQERREQKTDARQPASLVSVSR